MDEVNQAYVGWSYLDIWFGLTTKAFAKEAFIVACWNVYVKFIKVKTLYYKTQYVAYSSEIGTNFIWPIDILLKNICTINC